jgi:hypothetical protein
MAMGVSMSRSGTPTTARMCCWIFPMQTGPGPLGCCSQGGISTGPVLTTCWPRRILYGARGPAAGRLASPRTSLLSKTSLLFGKQSMR